MKVNVGRLRLLGMPVFGEIILFLGWRKMTIADIDDEALYQLSDVESKFSAPAAMLIQAAARYNEPIKLCVELDSTYKAELVNINCLIKGISQVTEAFKGNNKTIDSVPRYCLNEAVFLVVTWPKCKELVSNSSVTLTTFEEVYVHEKNSHQLPTQLISAENYAKALGLRLNIKWIFAAFHVDIPFGVFWPPEAFTISKDNMGILGFELRRYLSELASIESKKTEVEQVGLPATKITRDDPFREEMKLAIKHLILNKQKATVKPIMHYLMSIAGKEGSHIIEVSNEINNKGVYWVTSDGAKEFMDFKNLKNRLIYLRGNEPELFKIAI